MSLSRKYYERDISADSTNVSSGKVASVSPMNLIGTLFEEVGNLAMDGLHILEVMMTNGNSRMKNVRELPLVSHTFNFPYHTSNSS